MRLALRFDMRAPSIGVPPSVLYPTSVDMCEWADGLGFETVYLAEHHGADDGYCPSPIVQASAIAARTTSMRIHFSALIAVLHHPLRLAEDLAVLDLLSGGRIEMTLGIGYRPHEYTMMGVKQSQRVKLLEEIIEVFEKAWTGEPFDFRGQTVVVRPTPVQKPRPPLYIGGSTEASAYRAAKWGDNYFPAGPGLLEIYQAERRRLGLPVPPPPGGRGPLFLFVTDDPDRDWPALAPHVMYTSNSNAEWAKERGSGSTPYPPVTSLDELKASDKFAVVTPDECVDLATRLGNDAELTFQPLMGAVDPELTWRSLRLFESDVLPRLVGLGLRPPLAN
ncbi:LLM class flavin-dependent oxidoreductase [Desertimonas flava]|uniref:LLM class flavin-dependent oxidoreductase n=1 Tax=Desertimonas flava TaxID=2064846 RepID=UPI000E34E5EC|nr:LLM class flavin-dependent oxidoreductase [Desertimonas flava]